MMKRAVIVFLVVLCIIGVCVYAAQPLETASSRSALKRSQVSKRLQKGELAFKFNIKLRDGVPVLKLKLGAQPITVIFDTGSSQLNVGHKSCLDCNKSDGVYRENIPVMSKKRQIYYGSQHDTVVDMTDMLELPDGSGNKTLIEVPFVTTVSRQVGNQGNSSLNVMGMYAGNNNDGNFKSYILPDSYVLVVNLAHRDGFVAGVRPSKAAQIRSQHPNGFFAAALTRLSALPFYVVKIVQIDVCGHSLAELSDIRWCVIDTGSNMLTLPPAACEKALDCINRAIHPSMTLYLDGGVQIKMHRRHLMWRGGNEPMLDDDIQAIGGSKRLQQQTMVIGTHSLSDRCLMFTQDKFYVSEL